ncbi:MAG: GNAT family N-acetyltransferase, partial [Lachnospiraceae bacterium]|nr:GNAT family N-acetyltransferase [Lachnospiraceae bacterium]
MEYAFCGSQRKAGFTPEVLKAYCKEQYRLYGYGLWGVFLKEAACSGEADGKERLIGCCGFAEASEHESGHGLQLELEYMLSRPYWHRGIGNEMCRMALQYAGEYLRVDTVWVQVHEKNVAGYALARKLGFHPADDRGKCKHDGVGLLGLTNQRSADMIETDS